MLANHGSSQKDVQTDGNEGGLWEVMIATGVGLGFITYAFVKTLTGRFEDASLSVWFLAGLFVLKFALD